MVNRGSSLRFACLVWKSHKLVIGDSRFMCKYYGLTVRDSVTIIYNLINSLASARFKLVFQLLVSYLITSNQSDLIIIYSLIVIKKRQFTIILFLSPRVLKLTKATQQAAASERKNPGETRVGNQNFHRYATVPTMWYRRPGISQSTAQYQSVLAC